MPALPEWNSVQDCAVSWMPKCADLCRGDIKCQVYRFAFTVWLMIAQFDATFCVTRGDNYFLCKFYANSIKWIAHNIIFSAKLWTSDLAWFMLLHILGHCNCVQFCIIINHANCQNVQFCVIQSVCQVQLCVVSKIMPVHNCTQMRWHDFWLPKCAFTILHMQAPCQCRSVQIYAIIIMPWKFVQLLYIFSRGFT